jgi:hypothetical protein
VSRSSELNTGIKMINYKLIADAAQAYPNYQQAFDAMSVEMGENTYRDMSPNSLKMWAATFTEDYLILYNATDAISLLAMSMISSEKTPLYVSDRTIHPFIDAMPISLESRAGLYYMATKENKAWPNLRLASVKKAYEMRQRGDI